MIDTDKYEGHTDGSGWIWEAFWDKELVKFGKTDRQLIADAPKLLAEVKRLRDELDRQMEYIEWLEEFAPKAGEYNTSWDAYELAMGIHWTQMEDEEE